jgi:hypothetical protein
MTMSDRIHIAEAQIGDLQRTLGVVESTLEKADQVVVAGEKAGRGIVRILKVLLLVGIVVGVVFAVKSILTRSSGEVTFVAAEELDAEGGVEAVAAVADVAGEEIAAVAEALDEAIDDA